MDAIITVVRKAIDASGMTDKAVAERAGIRPQNLSASLCGRRRLLATEFIGLCRVLGISPDDVINVSKEAS